MGDWLLSVGSSDAILFDLIMKITILVMQCLWNTVSAFIYLPQMFLSMCILFQGCFSLKLRSHMRGAEADGF